MGLRDEILEQPAAAQRLLDAAPSAFAPIAAAAAARRPRFAVIAARGSSDNAGIYAQYLLAVRNGLIVALAAPSTITLYGARPDMADALVVGISQSGRSPDIVAVLEEARRQDALTVALTNDPALALADTADHVIDLHAGPERATAATKTYTAELLAAALLSTALNSPSAAEAADLARVPQLIAVALAAEGDARALAGRPRHAPAGGRARSRLQLRAVPESGRSNCRKWRCSPRCRIRRPISSTGRWRWPSPACRCWPWRGRTRARGAAGAAEPAKVDHGARLLVISDSPAARAIDAGLPLPAGSPGVAGADRRDRAGAAVRLPPDRRARPRSGAAAHDQQGHRDALINR